MKCLPLMFGAVVLALASPALKAEESATKVLECMRANIPESLRIQEVEMTATDRTGGSRVLKGKVYAVRDQALTRAMLNINAPSDLAGAAYLMRQTGADSKGDEYFFYLPSLGRVRRISGASTDSSLLGTDFSFSDMKELQNAFADSEAKLEKPQTLENRPMHVLSLTPSAGVSSRYSTVRAWVDQKACVALKVEFFEGAAVRKELSASAASLQQSKTYWYTSEALMRDLKEGTQTRLKIVGVTEGLEVPKRLFDPHSFYLGG